MKNPHHNPNTVENLQARLRECNKKFVALRKLVATPDMCNGCGKGIFWITTARNKRPAPIDPDGTSHFATCLHASEFKRQLPT